MKVSPSFGRLSLLLQETWRGILSPVFPAANRIQEQQHCLRKDAPVWKPTLFFTQGSGYLSLSDRAWPRGLCTLPILDTQIGGHEYGNASTAGGGYGRPSHFERQQRDCEPGLLLHHARISGCVSLVR